MSISPELVQELLQEHDDKKRTGPKRLIRTKTNYPTFRTNRFVKLTEVKGTCASRGCTTTTYFSVLGIPYCQIHTIHKLVETLEMMEGGIKV